MNTFIKINLFVVLLYIVYSQVSLNNKETIMERLDFASSGNADIRDNSTAWINGTLPLPDTYMIGKLCKNKHGIKGQSVRYVTNNTCVICVLEKRKKQSKPINTTHHKAMELYELQQEQRLLADFI